MKKVNPQRFQQKNPENISFKPSPISAEPPTIKPVNKGEIDKSERTNERTVKRTNERTNAGATENEKTNPVSFSDAYLIEVPAERKKTRHSFDIYEDQKSALSKIQLALVDEDKKKKPALGDMIQEAIDLYIKKKVEKLNNVKLVRKPLPERTNERSDKRTENNND